VVRKHESLELHLVVEAAHVVLGSLEAGNVRVVRGPIDVDGARPDKVIQITASLDPDMAGKVTPHQAARVRNTPGELG
jgi:hypothetical protein